MKKMGGVAALIDKLPGAARGRSAAAQLQDDKQFRRIEGIINSMTPQERAKPELIKASRKRRIAAGAGVPVQEVNRLLNQFEQMQKMMKMMQGRHGQDDAVDERHAARRHALAFRRQRRPYFPSRSRICAFCPPLFRARNGSPRGPVLTLRKAQKLA